MTCKLNRLGENHTASPIPEISRVVSIRESGCRLTCSTCRIKENLAARYVASQETRSTQVGTMFSNVSARLESRAVT